VEKGHLLPLCYPMSLVRLFMAARSASSTCATASACIFGRTCEYKSSVMPTLLWPSRSLAIFGWTASGWQAGVKGLPVYPYRLPDMLAAVHDAVFICEGEKDVDRLAGLGFVATTNPGGAGNWNADLNQWFVGKTCFVL